MWYAWCFHACVCRGRGCDVATGEQVYRLYHTCPLQLHTPLVATAHTTRRMAGDLQLCALLLALSADSCRTRMVAFWTSSCRRTLCIMQTPFSSSWDPT
jgi:hypothetical protein